MKQEEGRKYVGGEDIYYEVYSGIVIVFERFVKNYFQEYIVRLNVLKFH